jgi:hypothetical protein
MKPLAIVPVMKNGQKGVKSGVEQIITMRRKQWNIDD